MAKMPAKAWVCPVCGYVHYGSQPPEECPVCGAMGDLFEPQDVREEVLQGTGEAYTAVVAGAGIAGVCAAEALRNADPMAEVFLISNEPYLPYYRLNLTRYLAGEVDASQLDLHPEDWYTQADIQLLLNNQINAIDLQEKELTFQDKSSIPFHKLIITTGSHPFIPPIPGANRKNVITLRTRQDADFLLQACKENLRCVCIGGGLLGLETAGALARQGAHVTVLENQAWLLPRQLNQAAGELLQRRIQSMGIGVRTQVRIRELVGDDDVCGVLLEDGELLPAELVVISAGVRANVELARRAGLAVNQGILVDNTLRTSHPDVFAAGDVAEHAGILYGIWVPSQAQGTIAGKNVAGQGVEFTGLPRSNTLKVLGIDLFSIGQVVLQDASDLAVDAKIDGKYFCFVFREHLMVGSILLGDAALSTKVKNVIETRQDCSPLLAKTPGVKDIFAFLENS